MTERTRRSCALAVLVTCSLLLAASAPAATRRVGPGRTYATIRAAAQVCEDGDSVIVDPGIYSGDVASWTRPNLVVRCPGPGRAVLDADGSIENDKGIWVVTTAAPNFTAEGFEFKNCIASASEHNGCGIRVDAGNPGYVAIRNCYFHDNEMGVLACPDSLLVESCEFDRTVNPHGGNQHNVYVNTSACRVVMFRYNYSHRATTGHEFKSRARNTYVMYNRLADEDGTPAYTIDIPDGGRSYIIGNLIEQGPFSNNTEIISYAAESANNGNLDLYVVNNTIANDRSSGTFIEVRSGARARVVNNVFYGPGTPMRGGTFAASNNYQDGNKSHSRFVSNLDLHPTSETPSTIRDAGIPPGVSVTGFPLLPDREYVYDLASTPRGTRGALDLGAFEYAGAQNATADAKDLRHT